MPMIVGGGGRPDLQLFAEKVVTCGEANFVGEPTWLYIRPETRIQFGNSGQADSVLFDPVIKRATR